MHFSHPTDTRSISDWTSMSKATPLISPMPKSSNFGEHFASEQLPPSSHDYYGRAIGKIRYFANSTRLDVLFGLPSNLIFSQTYNTTLKSAETLIRYLKSTNSHGIHYVRIASTSSLGTYADANFANSTTSHSHEGAVHVSFEATFGWSSKHPKQLFSLHVRLNSWQLRMHFRRPSGVIACNLYYPPQPGVSPI